MSYDSLPDQVLFSNPRDLVLNVFISPSNPVLRSMGVRYILAMGRSQNQVETSKYKLRYVSWTGNFSIFEIPRTTP